jgi:hypothetical protein
MAQRFLLRHRQGRVERIRRQGDPQRLQRRGDVVMQAASSPCRGRPTRVLRGSLPTGV